MAPSSERPILFHYPPSIYSHRVLWYLWLRGIHYDECVSKCEIEYVLSLMLKKMNLQIQPPVMPRPDLASIGVGYRKMPAMAIGKDVYCDSRMIISKLESLYPGSNLTPQGPANAGVQKLLENWNIDGGIFANTVKLMPYWLENGLLQNKAFLDDRQTLMGGRRMTAEGMEAGRPDGLQHLRQAFDMLETTFLADGREWILGTKGPSVADIDGVWPFEWLIVDKSMRGSLPEEHFSPEHYPKVYAWVARFMDLVEGKKQAAPIPVTLDGNRMSERVRGSISACEIVTFEKDDPLKFQLGEQVEVFPSDYGQMGKTTGTIIGLSTNEVVVRNQLGIHVHFPRWNFSIKRTGASSQPALASITPVPKVPKMRLIYHPLSPFSRKVFILAHELNLSAQFVLQKVVVCPVPFAGWSDNNADVAAYNPMSKIPCLLSDSVPDGIFDSRIICEYLTDVVGSGIPPAKKDTRYWDLHTLHAAADGLMDAAVLITYELRIRKPREMYFEEWVQGQTEKIIRVLDRFERAATSGILLPPPVSASAPASMDEIAVAVATVTSAKLGFLGIDWKTGRPRLVEWMKQWEKRDSFVRTGPTRDWITGEESGDEPVVSKI